LKASFQRHTGSAKTHLPQSDIDRLSLPEPPTPGFSLPIPNVLCQTSLYENRIATLRDLSHRVSFEIVAEITFAHHDLLTSNLGNKASTNLRAIHADLQGAADRRIQSNLTNHNITQISSFGCLI
jgi:hypothetical protein